MDIIEQDTFIERHPWEIARAYCIAWAAPKLSRTDVVCDVGAGDLFFSRQLRAGSFCTVAAVDVAYAHAPVSSDGITTYTDVQELAEHGFDVLFAMDVLEHVQEDSAFLKLLASKVREGGRAVITVPAFPFLFSAHDVALKHIRRYSRQELIMRAEQAGLLIAECFYFFLSLFVLRACSKLFARKNGGAVRSELGGWKFPRAHIITRTIVGILIADFMVCRFLARVNLFLPGLSVCLIAEKKR